MNPIYEQIFNPQYVNPIYLRQCQMQHDCLQNMEIAKAVKAIHDYFDAMRKLDPQYLQKAFDACALAALSEFQKSY